MTDIAWLTRRPIAHRGLHDMNGARWENTLSAFEAAAARGYAIECDVRLSRDGEPVVFHDSDLKRLTGEPGIVHERTAAELARLRIGGTDDCVPTLAEALESIAARVPVVVELKGGGNEAGLAAAVGRTLSRYPGQAALMSFEHELVRNLARTIPDRPRGLTAQGTTEAEIEAHFSMLASDIAFVSYSVADLPNGFVSFVRDRLAMPVITWTVKTSAGIETTRRHADQMTFEGFAPDLAMQHGSNS